jgi:timeless
MDTLYWYYVQSKKHKDIVGHIIKQIKDSGQKAKSRMAVIQQLLQQDIISQIEYDDLMKVKFKNQIFFVKLIHNFQNLV